MTWRKQFVQCFWLNYHSKFWSPNGSLTPYFSLGTFVILTMLYHLDLSNLLHGFVNVVLCFSRPLPNKTKLKFDQDFKACWSFCFELKVLNESKYSMSWVCSALGNVFTYFWLYLIFFIGLDQWRLGGSFQIDQKLCQLVASKLERGNSLGNERSYTRETDGMR